MKLIKNGKWNDPWSGKYFCSTCDAEILVEEVDLQPQGNETDSNYYICLECKKANYIHKDHLPLRVKEELNKKRKYWNSGDPW